MGTSTAGGVPIRLVRRDGDLINLNCTDFTFGVQRSVPAIPVPAFGERIGADMNVVSVDIRLNCVLTDDDCSGAAQFPKKAASAFLDFSATSVFEATDDEDASDAWMLDDGSTGSGVTIANLNGKSFSIRTTHQVTQSIAPITVLFDTSVLPAASSAATTILTVGLSAVADSGSALATALHTAFTAHAGAFVPDVTSTGGTSFTDAFTVGTPTTGKNTDFGNCRIDLTQRETGANGNSSTPKFWTDEDNNRLPSPSFSSFAKGTNTHSCKSAGDKMQDLIASVSNTNIGGAIGGAFNLSGKTKDRMTDMDIGLTFRGAADDYIVGLQLPYNSLLHADTDPGTSLPLGYGTRNFLIVTGITNPDDQNAVGNTNTASVVFDSRDIKTGIRGTVTQCNFSYAGAETVYSAELTFQPIDLIVGL